MHASEPHLAQVYPAQRPIFGPMHAPQADHGLGRYALIQQECGKVLPDGAEPHQAGDFAARGPASEDCCQLPLQLWCRPLELIPALQACLAPSNPGASWQPAADLPHSLPARAGLSAADLFGLKRCLELDNQDQSVLSAHLLILHWTYFITECWSAEDDAASWHSPPRGGEGWFYDGPTWSVELGNVKLKHVRCSWSAPYGSGPSCNRWNKQVEQVETIRPAIAYWPKNHGLHTN